MSNQYSNNLKKGILLVFFANFINLIISLINGFILPKYLSIDIYASIKTYQLYSIYIGILALGYSDGLYLKFGGARISDITDLEINICRTNLLLFQGAMSVIVIAIGLIIHDKLLVIAAFTVIPVNIATTFKNILQATGEFKAYSSIMNYTSLITFFGMMILLFVVRINNDLLYVGIMVAVTYIVWLLLERKLHRIYGFSIKFVISFKHIAENIKSGIVLMLGNFSSILMTSIDRWFVKLFLNTTDFALYSFVVSTENLVAVFINPIISTMYNYICVTSDYKSLRTIKRKCMIFALFLVSGAYFVKLILEIYLTKYLQSQYVLFILFSTEILFIMIKGIYINIYKAQKKQITYMKQLVVLIIFSCILNTAFYLVFKSIEGIAFATLLSVIFWYAICSFTVKEIKPDWKEISVLIIGILTFILSGIFLPSIIGLVVYIVVVFSLCGVLMKKDLFALINMVLRSVKLKKSDKLA